MLNILGVLYLKKLVSILQSKEILYDILTILFFVLSLNLSYFYVVFFVNIIINYKRINIKFVFIILIIIFCSYYFIVMKEVNIKFNDKFYIVSKRKLDNGYSYIIKKGLYKYQIYLNQDLNIGQYIKIEGWSELFDGERIPHGFNKNNFYLAKGIKTQIKVINYEVLKEQNILANLLNISTDNYYFNFFIGKGNIDSTSYESFGYINVLNYFTVSGLNFYLVCNILNRIYDKTNIEKNIQELIMFSILVIFLILTSFSNTMIRLLIYEILKKINKKYKLQINNFTLLNLTFLIMLLINPFNIVNQNFLIVYIICISINLLSPIFNNENFIIKTIKITLIINLILIPFTGKINFLSILLSPVFIFLITYIMFPVSILSLLFKRSIKVLIVIEKFLLTISKLDFNVYLGKLNTISIIFYFVLLVILVYVSKKTKIFVSLTLILVILSPRLFINFTDPSLYFLDVGQGDSAVYISRDNVVVVDCFNSVETFLKNKGINKINYLILTHSDLDHIKEAQSLIDNFKVENIVLSKFDLEYELVVKNSNLINAEAGLKINDKELMLNFFGPLRNYHDKNQNSLVFSLEFNNNKILFTGDVAKEAELELVNYYGTLLQAEILKIAHHGSSSSSSEEFIKKCNPKYAIISVAKINNYNLPSDEVLNRLLKYNIKIYKTSINKTIILRGNKFSLMN